MDANIPALNGTRVFCGVVGGVFNGGVAVAISVDFVVAVLALLTRTGVIGRARRRCSGRSILCSGTQN